MQDEVGIGHGHGHDHDYDERLSDAEVEAIQRAIMEHDTLELVTVGVDIGSSTSHLLFARVLFERRGHKRNDQFVVVERTVEWRSPILLTPFRPDGTIDAHRLARFVQDCYAAAGIVPSEVDSGAVILTGEAIKKRNARAIDEMIAGGSGRFVCATAGHRLECILAAHGSGATELNQRRGGRGLHVDIGGGTTKLALIEGGEVRSVAAFAAGGRLIAKDDVGDWTRIDGPARLVAEAVGLEPVPETFGEAGARRLVASRMAELVADQIVSGPTDSLGRALELTSPLDRPGPVDYLTFSGGVSEYLFGHEAGDFGDLAPELAAGVAAQFGDRITVPVVETGQRIRATVIGASQFSVQVSGRTIHLGGAEALPVVNVPVVRLGTPLVDGFDPAVVAAELEATAGQHDVDLGGAVALAVSWAGTVSYSPLKALATAVASVAGAGVGGSGDGELLVLVVDADIGQALGAILVEEVGLRRPLVVLDGIELGSLDYLDVGEHLDPPGVVPVVIKSLLFA